MEAHYPIDAEPATADYILAVLRDEHRLLGEEEPLAEPDIGLTFETTIEDWRRVCDLVGWRRLGRALNRHWGIDCSDAQWHAVLEPRWKRRLDGVCALIARHTTRPRIRPARLLGADCLTGGAFLTVRSLLHNAGADADKIKPSAPLAPFARRYPEVFLGPILQLAPGALPPVDFRAPVHPAAWIMLAGIITFLVGACFSLAPLMQAGGLLFVASCLANSLITPRLPTSVQFGNLRTFRDLARALANQASP